jgi:hypothetical protein
MIDFMRMYLLGLFGLYGLSVLAGCGGGGNNLLTGPLPSQNPVPSIVTLSPNNYDQNGPAFTLSVIGSNFISGSVVQWGGSARPTTLISGNLLTAQISATDVSTAASTPVTVTNPSPGGGASNSKNFTVPCNIPAPAAAASQTNAKVGAYFFDGWTGSLSNFHYNGLLYGNYQDREPLSGWEDDNDCAVEKQLAVAHNFGIDFFIYEWYFNATTANPGQNLNSALQITSTLPDRHAMQFAMMYVSGGPFYVDASNWTSAVNEWVGYMTDRDYFRVNGKPLFIVDNVGATRAAFGSPSAVQAALQQLRNAAVGQGLPGVYIVGGFGVPDGTIGQSSLSAGFSIAGQDGFDAIAFLGYPFAQPPINGMRPLSDLSAAGHWTWDQAALISPLPFIPTAMDGWDPRPWDERASTGELMWYSRSPQEVAAFVSDAIDWANTNPQLRPEPSPAPPIVLITSWNEMGEGNHILPTVGDGTSYGDAIATMLTGP